MNTLKQEQSILAQGNSPPAPLALRQNEKSNFSYKQEKIFNERKMCITQQSMCGSLPQAVRSPILTSGRPSGYCTTRQHRTYSAVVRHCKITK